MSAWSFYTLADGLFTGGRYSGPADWLEANTPEGCAAIEGVYDHLSNRVDLETGEVVDYQPPKPGDTDLVSHDWDAQTKRWVGSETLLALERKAHAAIDTAAGQARNRYITDVPGQQAVYLRKAEQARAYRGAGYAGAVPPYVQAEAEAMQMTTAAAADRILAVAELWDDTLSPAIERERIGGKARVTVAKDSNNRAALLQEQAATIAALKEI